MTTKVKVTREVAEAIESMRNDGRSNYNIMRQAEGAVVTPAFVTIRRWAFDTSGGGTSDLLMQALVNGYEVEKTPEDEVRDYYAVLKLSEEYVVKSGYSGSQQRQGWQSVTKTLDLLGIKIEGVNV